MTIRFPSLNGSTRRGTITLENAAGLMAIGALITIAATAASDRLAVRNLDGQAAEIEQAVNLLDAARHGMRMDPPTGWYWSEESPASPTPYRILTIHFGHGHHLSTLVPWTGGLKP